jgi:hypothetical protein
LETEPRGEAVVAGTHAGGEQKRLDAATKVRETVKQRVRTVQHKTVAIFLSPKLHLAYESRVFLGSDKSVGS